MLLDRKRVKYWQKWVFGFMALIMAGFLVMIPISGSLGCNGSATTDALAQIDKEIAKYKTQTAADPTNVDGWLNLAENYQLRANQQAEGSAAQQADWAAAIAAYKVADKILRKDKTSAGVQTRVDNLSQLASVYLTLKDYPSAVGVYQKITGLRPDDAQGFFDLGTIAINAGDKSTALLAFTRFLELDPTSPDATAVQDWITSATASPSPSPTPSASPSP